MAIDQAGEIQRVTIAAYYSDSQVELNNIAYLCTGAGGTDTKAALGANVYAGYVAQWLPEMSPESQLYGYRITQLMPRPAPVAIEVANPQVGTGTGNYLGTQARPILRFRTLMSGRGNRGRIYVFTPTVAGIDTNGYPTAGLNSAITGLGLALALTFTSAGSTWTLCIAHRAPGPTYTATQVDHISVPGVFGTQRRSGNTGRLNPYPW